MYFSPIYEFTELFVGNSDAIHTFFTHPHPRGQPRHIVYRYEHKSGKQQESRRMKKGKKRTAEGRKEEEGSWKREEKEKRKER